MQTARLWRLGLEKPRKIEGDMGKRGFYDGKTLTQRTILPLRELAETVEHEESTKHTDFELPMILYNNREE